MIMKYRVAIIGLGKIGLLYDFEGGYGRPLSHTFAFVDNENFDVIAGVDKNVVISKKFLEVATSGKFYTEYEKMLDEMDIDVVSICTPPEYHLEQIRSILWKKAARVIFCEKPIVQNIKEYLELKKILKEADCILVPNISRRFSSGLNKVAEELKNGIIGKVQKIHVRYTRGIYNTGAHLFDLLSWWVGKISRVQTIAKISTSSELEGENSYTFNFTINADIVGYAEAFNDRQYYFFEVDIYGSEGKLCFQNSGDSVSIYKVAPHSIFPEHKELVILKKYEKILADSNFILAVENIKNILSEKGKPLCTLENAAYPLYVASAIEKSYKTKKWESVDYE